MAFVTFTFPLDEYKKRRWCNRRGHAPSQGVQADVRHSLGSNTHATFDLPSVTTTSYANEKLVFR